MNKTDKINVAVLLTCHNRRNLTETCIRSMVKAGEKFAGNIALHFFLTDDACTDGTPEAAADTAGNTPITIIKADGNAFWAGGMRMAWNKAIEFGGFDFYLLLNDDTEVWDNLFEELLLCDEFARNMYGKQGIYSGNTAWKHDRAKISFGGKVAGKGLLKRFVRLQPSGTPQRCDIVNGNILMVPDSVVKSIGIFPECYIHGAADNDYGMRANKRKLPVLITGGFCGSCDADNYDYLAEMRKLSAMTIKERVRYLKFPVRSIHDSMAYSLRWRKSFVLIIPLMRAIQILSPALYYKIFNLKRRQDTHE